MEKIQEELLTHFASLREHDTKFKELATGQGDAPQVALQGISQEDRHAGQAERKKRRKRLDLVKRMLSKRSRPCAWW